MMRRKLGTEKKDNSECRVSTFLLVKYNERGKIDKGKISQVVTAQLQPGDLVTHQETIKEQSS